MSEIKNLTVRLAAEFHHDVVQLLTADAVWSLGHDDAAWPYLSDGKTVLVRRDGVVATDGETVSTELVNEYGDEYVAVRAWTSLTITHPYWKYVVTVAFVEASSECECPDQYGDFVVAVTGAAGPITDQVQHLASIEKDSGRVKTDA